MLKSDSKHHTDIIELLVQDAPCWRAVSLSLPHWAFAFLERGRGHFDCLQEANITVFWQLTPGFPEAKRTIDVFQIAPQLHRATLIACQSIILPWAQIHHLDFQQASFHEVAQTLALCPNLQSLELGFFLRGGMNFAFTCPSLTSISLSDGKSLRFCSSMTLPALKEFVALSFPAGLLADLKGILTPLLTIDKLHIGLTDLDQGNYTVKLMEVLAATPNLIKLSLGFDQIKDDAILSILAAALTVGPERQIILPRLSHVTIRPFIGDLTVTSIDTNFLDTLDSRRRAWPDIQILPLCEFRLSLYPQYDSIGTFTFPNIDLKRLRDLEERGLDVDIHWKDPRTSF
jgi:hypothetical protein